MTGASSPPPAPRVLTRHVEVETPENVSLDLELAGLGSRALAAIIDAIILTGWTLALVLLSLALQWVTDGSRLVGVVLLVMVSASFAAYFIVFEGLRHGQTPGKRALGIRVVRDTGHPVSLGGAVVRTVLRLADVLPPPLYVVGGTLVAVSPKGQRLGDWVAGCRRRPVLPH